MLRFNFGQIDIRVGSAVSARELVHNLLVSRGLPIDSLQLKSNNDLKVANDRYTVSRYVAFEYVSLVLLLISRVRN